MSGDGSSAEKRAEGLGVDGGRGGRCEAVEDAEGRGGRVVARAVAARLQPAGGLFHRDAAAWEEDQPALLWLASAACAWAMASWSRR
ncbi:hypothetical protein A6V37_38365 [Paraburkholderia ginsengiterrae]|uniref:Uncharacterized protein n=1 Tax=Paraburkholderia ginsengiterrae TaxID=1462993 RepID=A0A1A9N5S4_9BURK|nr:hypothetical protein A6V37_38365 [Paraburkholderia ginsengiterrae]